LWFVPTLNSQIRVAAEEDTVHVPDLTLVPVGTREDLDSRRDGGDLVGVGLDADTRLVGDREEVVDDLYDVSTARVLFRW
jgi:hypothetical protein